MAGLITANGKLITKSGAGGYFVVNHLSEMPSFEEPIEPITGGTVSDNVYPVPAQRRYGLASNFSGSMVVVSSTAGTPYLERYDWSEANNRYEFFGDAVDIASTKAATVMSISKDGNFMAVPYGGAQSLDSQMLVTYKWNGANNRYEKTNLPSPMPGVTSSYGCYMTRLSPDGQFLAVASYAAGSARRLATYKWNEANFRYEATAWVDQDVPQPTYSLGVSDDYSKCVVPYQTSSPFAVFYKWSEANNRYERLPPADVGGITHGLNGFMSADGNIAVVNYQASGFYSFKWNETNGRYEKTANPYPHYSDYTYVASNNNATDLLVVLNNTGRLTVYHWVEANNRYEEQVGLIDSPVIGNYTYMTPNPPLSRIVLSSPVSPFLHAVNFE